MSADTAERRCLEACVAEAGRAILLDPLQLGNGVGGPVLLVQDGGQVGARGGEAWCQLQRPAEKIFGIAITADARREFGQHPNRAIIVRIAPKPVLQQRLGLVQAVGKHCIAGAKKGRIARRGTDRALFDICAPFLLPYAAERQSEQAKGGGRARTFGKRPSRKDKGLIGPVVQHPIPLGQGIFDRGLFGIRAHKVLVGQKKRSAKPARSPRSPNIS